ncbi:fold protein [Oscillospiraceae bacterium OttesenSCG-928-F05]|nr:fold protein [Oscillospiraceae bacterium OttesenSCG-928-F05]
MENYPLKVACTPKEAACIIGNLFAEIKPICEVCEVLGDGEFVLFGALVGVDDEYAYVKLKDYGFDYYGDVETLEHIRETRCLYGAVGTAKEDGGTAQ